MGCDSGRKPVLRAILWVFFKDNTRMLFGDAKASVDGILQSIPS